MEEKRLVQAGDPDTDSVGWEKNNPDSLKYGATGSDDAVPEKKRPTKFVKFLRKLMRKKVFTQETMEATELRRCLSTLDLINLGIGSCICNGIYIVVGEVAHSVAGPGVFLSFLTAGLASCFAAMCYAEFAARVPRAGSAYVYSYVTVGEFMAFVIGWNLLLEYIIGTASSARALSMYFNSMIDNVIKDAFREYMPINVYGFSRYPDFFSLAITLVTTAILAVGVRESARFNNIFTGVNMFVIVYVVVCGLFKANLENWQLPESEVPSDAGVGGFLPFGFSGMMSGAATCFYAYVGFDCIATTGEESRNPEKTIPIAVVAALLLILVSYCSVSAVVTLMCPYFLINVNTPVPFVFKYVGWDVAQYIIAIGAMCGLCTSLLGSMFPLPRVLYAMAADGVVYKTMAKVSPRFKTPLIGTCVSGLFAGVMAMIFSLAELIEMMSIGTLLAYTLVAVCVLILRYETEENLPKALKAEELDRISEEFPPLKLRYMLFPPTPNEPSDITSAMTKCCVAAMCVTQTAFCGTLVLCTPELADREPWAICLVIFLGLIILFFLFCIRRQPTNNCRLSFEVPLIPYVPAFSTCFNIFLMFKLDKLTWIRFGIWMVLGFLMYFCYGIDHATMGEMGRRKEEKEEEEVKKATSSSNLTADDGNEKDSDPFHYDSLGDHSN